jgi:hypothetical protein
MNKTKGISDAIFNFGGHLLFVSLDENLMTIPRTKEHNIRFKHQWRIYNFDGGWPSRSKKSDERGEGAAPITPITKAKGEAEVCQKI